MNYKRAIAYIKPYKVRFAWAMVCMCVFALMTSAYMLLIKLLFDRILSNNPPADNGAIDKVLNFTGLSGWLNTSDKMDMLLIHAVSLRLRRKQVAS